MRFTLQIHPLPSTLAGASMFFYRGPSSAKLAHGRLAGNSFWGQQFSSAGALVVEVEMQQ